MRNINSPSVEMVRREEERSIQGQCWGPQSLGSLRHNPQAIPLPRPGLFCYFGLLTSPSPSDWHTNPGMQPSAWHSSLIADFAPLAALSQQHHGRAAPGVPLTDILSRAAQAAFLHPQFLKYEHIEPNMFILSSL